MRLVEFLPPEAVHADLAGRTSREVLEELCRPLVAAADPARLLEALLLREALGSTGIGGGFAIPHARVEGLPGLLASFGRAPSGIPFGAIDNQPVRLFFLLFAPAGSSAGLHLRALARISRVFRSEALREALLSATTSLDLHRLIAEADAAAEST